MPNGNVIRCESIAELDMMYSLRFEQYQGFTGELNDTILSKFTVVTDDYPIKEVKSNSAIQSLKTESIKALRFEKIPEAKIQFNDLLSYIGKIYPTLKASNPLPGVEVGIDYEMTFVDENNRTIIKLQYSKLGISGSFVILNSFDCE